MLNCHKKLLNVSVACESYSILLFFNAELQTDTCRINSIESQPAKIIEAIARTLRDDAAKKYLLFRITLTVESGRSLLPNGIDTFAAGAKITASFSLLIGEKRSPFEL